MKILYAASNNSNAKIQLARFQAAIGPKYELKIAAYKKSSPRNLNIDWTLDALLNIYKPETISLDNDNLSIYLEQVQAFSPDLIISDLEYFTSIAAVELNIPLWQCSSSLINFALSRKYDLGLFKHYAYSLNRTTFQTQRTVNIIDNSSRNFVYSHYADTKDAPALKSSFEWARPYHQIAKSHIPCQHSVTAALSANDKSLLDVLKCQPDSVAFLDHASEKYESLLLKDIGIEDEYYCNLKNSDVFLCQGQMSFLADAFYNGKFSLIYPIYSDTESLTNSQISQKLGLGKIMSYSDTISLTSLEVTPNYNAQTKYLHEYLEEL